jgi:hypothetical protein
LSASQTRASNSPLRHSERRPSPSVLSTPLRTAPLGSRHGSRVQGSTPLRHGAAAVAWLPVPATTGSDSAPISDECLWRLDAERSGTARRVASSPASGSRSRGFPLNAPKACAYTCPSGDRRSAAAAGPESVRVRRRAGACPPSGVPDRGMWRRRRSGAAGDDAAPQIEPERNRRRGVVTSRLSRLARGDPLDRRCYRPGLGSSTARRAGEDVGVTGTAREGRGWHLR